MSRPEIDADLETIDAALRGEDDGSELALLVADVRASAPRMSPGLERRIEGVMAPRPKRAWRWRPVLAGGGGVAPGAARGIPPSLPFPPGTRNPPPSPGAPRRGHAPPPPPPPAGPPPPPARAPAATPAAGAAAPTQRRVERDISLALAAPEARFSSVTDDVVRTTDDYDGIVQSSNVEQAGRAAHADFDLRIPSSRLNAAVAALSRLAHVRARSAGTRDVTGSYDAAAGRLADARAERRALLRALSRVTDDRQAARLRDRLREVRERIGRERRALDALRQRTDRARVLVTVDAERTGAAAPPHHGGWTPLHDALRVLEATAGVLVVALAVLAPIGLLAALAFAAARLARRRRREAALG